MQSMSELTIMRGAALVAWRWLAAVQGCVGVLPASGWPVQPAPWPTWLAYAVAALHVSTTELHSIVSHADVFSSTFAIGWTVAQAGMRVVEKVWVVRQGAALCRLMRGLVLYEGRHPLPARSWALVLAATLAFLPQACAKVNS
ncbi:hypothetical protein ONE63_005190 [Megalurothrips usitatus]|uniref:Uncharacterized protein n=1 Tax=Megalurothrips usitatus TaxID=439358 RepID=A0AAV7XYR0_9NEOP|nr:hypothetical protein ONE63_005190 [Megalurothrips usitatus]